MNSKKKIAVNVLYDFAKKEDDKEEKKKIYRSLGAMGGILLAILFW